MNKRKIYLCLVLLSCVQLRSHAQGGAAESVFDFVAREVVIFEDDFSSYPVGHFPDGWEMIPAFDENKSGVRHPTRTSGLKAIKVAREGNRKAVDLGTSFFHIAPPVDLSRQLRDSFTLEFDYRFVGKYLSWFAITFYSENQKKDGCVFGKKDNYMCLWPDGSVIVRNAIPDSLGAIENREFDPYSWHHVSISYKNGAMDIYTDSAKMLHVPRCQHPPENLMFNSWPTARVTNIRVAVGSQLSPVNTLVTNRTLTTHYIFFDVDKAIIKPGSTAYVRELADLLVKHSKLKLEINGHTDTDGDAAHNQELSLARATAVKEALVAKGVAADRMSVNGYGSVRPLKRGNTPEIKALNRRVEFILK